jgi:predicted RNA methylase
MRIDPQVLSFLSMLEYPSATSVRIAEQLDRATYARVNKVLEALGGKWNRSAKAHVFDSDARARIEIAITTGEVETGQDVGHFPTPAPLARRLVEMADVRPKQHVLEPSAGTGRIVDAVLEIGDVQVYAVERDAARRQSLSDRAGAMGHRGALHVGQCEDFMTYPATGGFDRVVMNPPFCRVGLGDHLDHVRHAFGMLVEGGILVSVLPASVTFRRDRRYLEFREWCEERGGIRPLPSGSFKESGTGVETVVVRLRQESV